MSCHGLCKRLYRAHRDHPNDSMYVKNRRCSKCDRFISLDGIYMGKVNWRCKCCNGSIRHTPYAGRKVLEKYGVRLNKVSEILETCSVRNTQ